MQTLLAALERAIEQLMKQYGGGNTTPGGGDRVELPRQPPPQQSRPLPPRQGPIAQPPAQKFPFPPHHGPIARPVPQPQPRPPVHTLPFPPTKGGPVAEPGEPPVFKWPFPGKPGNGNETPGIPRSAGGACGSYGDPPSKGRTGGTLGN
ncbi:MAG TPA: hypothetical protein VIG99_15915 [Myxococcaceae bacterium]